MWIFEVYVHCVGLIVGLWILLLWILKCLFEVYVHCEKIIVNSFEWLDNSVHSNVWTDWIFEVYVIFNGFEVYVNVEVIWTLVVVS